MSGESAREARPDGYWETLASSIATEGDAAVDRLTQEALEGEPDPTAVPYLLDALNRACSESSKRGVALALARGGVPGDADVVEALEQAYMQAKRDASLSQALLGTLGLLGLRCPTARAAASSAVQKLRLTDSPHLLIAGAKVIGLLTGQRADVDLRRKLEQFACSGDPGVEAEARYQLALLLLATSFEAQTREELLAGLREARIYFVAAESLEEIRPDAALLRALIDIVSCFDRVAADRDAASISSLIESVDYLRHAVGGLGERVFRGYRSDASNRLAARVLEIAEALERGATQVIEAPEWTALFSTVVILAELYTIIRSRDGFSAGHERLDVALSGVAERVYSPRLGPILTEYVGHVRLARIIRDYERDHGADDILRGLRALESEARSAMYESASSFSVETQAALATLSAQTGRTPREFVDDAIQAIQRGAPQDWAARVGIVSRTMESELACREPMLQPLHELLCSLFSIEHFWRWMRHGPDGERICRDLPGRNPSLNELVEAALDNLKRRGYLDSGFFKRLRSEFPRRSLEIDRVARSWP